MQARLQRLLENRTRMLAALSHDLRTPLTLLRLRTEALPESEERDRMLATLDEADTMVGATLSFARDQTVTETLRRIDVAALVGVDRRRHGRCRAEGVDGSGRAGGAGVPAWRAAARDRQPDRQRAEIWRQRAGGVGGRWTGGADHRG